MAIDRCQPKSGPHLEPSDQVRRGRGHAAGSDAPSALIHPEHARHRAEWLATYAHPGGEESYCYNTKFADVERTTPTDQYTSTLGELEVLTPEPVADIPLHLEPGLDASTRRLPPDQGMLRLMKIHVLLPLLALGCSSKSDTGEPIAGESHIVWAGWNHQWGLLSHRISLVRVKAGEDGSAESGILGGDWSTGESWSDDVNVRVHQQSVTTSALEFTSGEVSITVGPDGEATVPIPDAAGDYVVLQGFEIDTDLPARQSGG